ncbi:MAG: sodium:proton antiporter [candidate division WOR-3 bacterium]
MTESIIFYGIPIFLITMGLLIILTTKNLFKMLLGLATMESGVNIFIIALGYIRSGTAPILSEYPKLYERVVDPVPQALVLTAIVIGIAVIAMGVVIVIRIKEKFGTVNINKIRGMRW